jgi:hypothetical protein
LLFRWLLVLALPAPGVPAFSPGFRLAAAERAWQEREQTAGQTDQHRASGSARGQGLEKIVKG